MSNLDGVRIKLARAELHLQELRKSLDEFARSRPYSISSEILEATGEQVFRVADQPSAPPDFPEIGDTLYNLRSGLDHLAYQLVTAAMGRPTRATAFPIFDDLRKFKHPRAQAKIEGMTSEMKDLVETYQPFSGNHANRDESLWALEEYGNIDKHRHLLTMPTSTHDFLWQPGGEPSYIHHGVVEFGTELLRFPSDQRQSQVHTMPSVSFAEPPLHGDEVYRSLFFMHYITAMIVSDFEARFFMAA